MLRLSAPSFQREGRWLLVVVVLLPTVGVLVALAWPALARWLGWH